MPAHKLFLQCKSGLEVNFLVHLQSFAIKIFPPANSLHGDMGCIKILTRKRLLVDIFVTRRFSKSPTFCKFGSINFEP